MVCITLENEKFIGQAVKGTATAIPSPESMNENFIGQAGSKRTATAVHGPVVIE